MDRVWPGPKESRLEKMSLGVTLFNGNLELGGLLLEGSTKASRINIELSSWWIEIGQEGCRLYSEWILTHYVIAKVKEASRIKNDVDYNGEKQGD
ncbi:hypothetical protein QQP08_009198 [Theobroma cacao]|nr:hypothetical protein QQP08_009198 [Theobroma cacao]